MLQCRSFRGVALATLMLAARASAQTPPSTSAAPATVSGVVWDSLTRRPFAGATVQLLQSPHFDTSYTVTADSLGGFRVGNVRPGHYLAGFFHPALDTLGIDPPVHALDVAPGSTVRLTLALPGPARVTSAICGPSATASDSTGLLIGHVRDADGGEPIAGSMVVVVWNELVIGDGRIRNERRQVPVHTDAHGWYAICHLPSDGGLTARAEHGADTSGFVDLAIPAGGVAVQEFGIGRDERATAAAADTGVAGIARRGRARLTGTVKNKAGRPLTGAQLMIVGSGVTATVSEAGVFALGGLPPGTQTLEARYLGYAPKRMSITLSSKEPRSVSVVMDERAVQLDAVTVYGKANSRRMHDITGFLDRRKAGFGRFFAREDIEKMYAFSVCDVLRRVPGARIGSGGTIGCDVQFRGANGFGSCHPTVYIDGAQMGEQHRRPRLHGAARGRRRHRGVRWRRVDAHAISGRLRGDRGVDGAAHPVMAERQGPRCAGSSRLAILLTGLGRCGHLARGVVPGELADARDVELDGLHGSGRR